MSAKPLASIGDALIFMTKAVVGGTALITAIVAGAIYVSKSC